MNANRNVQKNDIIHNNMKSTTAIMNNHISTDIFTKLILSND